MEKNEINMLVDMTELPLLEKRKTSENQITA